MKKLLCMLLALTVVLVAFAGIASAEEAANWKIAIMTGTTSQGEEEFLCDFLVVLAQYNELEDFRFAFGKFVLGGIRTTSSPTPIRISSWPSRRPPSPS